MLDIGRHKYLFSSFELYWTALNCVELYYCLSPEICKNVKMTLHPWMYWWSIVIWTQCCPNMLISLKASCLVGAWTKRHWIYVPINKRHTQWGKGTQHGSQEMLSTSVRLWDKKIMLAEKQDWAVSLWTVSDRMIHKVTSKSKIPYFYLLSSTAIPYCSPLIQLPFASMIYSSF